SGAHYGDVPGGGGRGFAASARWRRARWLLCVLAERRCGDVTDGFLLTNPAASGHGVWTVRSAPPTGSSTPLHTRRAVRPTVPPSLSTSPCRLRRRRSTPHSGPGPLPDSPRGGPCSSPTHPRPSNGGAGVRGRRARQEAWPHPTVRASRRSDRKSTRLNSSHV